jgi:hypothetical protein
VVVDLKVRTQSFPTTETVNAPAVPKVCEQSEVEGAAFASCAKKTGDTTPSTKAKDRPKLVNFDLALLSDMTD